MYQSLHSTTRKSELGIDVEIVESLGAFEHVYYTSDMDGVDSKHYLANGYVVDVTDGEVEPHAQHARFEIFRSAPDPCHKYVETYVDASSVVDGWT